MSNRLRFAILILCALSLGLGCRPRAKTEGTNGPRVIHFPKDRSIGKCAIFRADRHGDDIKEDKLRNARGDVEVPDNMQLFLMFADETLRSNEKPIDLSPLDRLRPTDIQAFTVQPFVRVSAEELNRLRRHVSLRAIVLGGLHQIDDLCLAPLADLKLLEVVQLPEARITDNGLAHLAGLPHLQVLNLYGTKVTDLGLKYLKGMSELKVLDLRNTKVTEAGVKEVQRAHPQCAIQWGVPGEGKSR